MNPRQTSATLVQLQLRNLFADRWAGIGCLMFCIILLVELGLTAREFDNFQASISSASAEARQNWLNQGDRDPHGAAHHGTFLFKSPSPLAIFDPGVFPYLGTTIRIEAHVRHRLTNRPGENEVQPLRNALVTPAELVQGVAPLLLILLGCGSIAYERQRGTLKLIRSLGVRWPAIVIAKTLSLVTIGSALTAPYLVAIIVAAVRNDSTAGGDDLVLRALLLFVLTLAGLACWSCLVVAASAHSASPNSALSALLLVWTVTTLFLPSITPNLAQLTHALPSQEEVKKWSDRRKYGDGESQNIFRTIREDLEQDMLRKHQVKSTRDLPFSFDGLLMQEAEKITDDFYQSDTDRLHSQFSWFERAVSAASYCSPYIACHRLSMMLAGTDSIHHEHFDRVAEDYRRNLVLVVNKADTQKDDAPDALRGSDLWKSVAEFDDHRPSLARLPRTHWTPLIILLVWTGAAFLIALIPKDTV